MADELPPPPQPGSDIPAEDLARLLMAAGMPPAEPPPSRGALRRKLLLAGLVAMIGIGASVLSCVGQSFSYRQAHALEGIEQQLKEIRTSCPVVPPSPEGTP